jgi:acyl-CoA synthetase (AMP-forming)/AMP-acid ligase II
VRLDWEGNETAAHDVDFLVHDFVELDDGTLVSLAALLGLVAISKYGTQSMMKFFSSNTDADHYAHVGLIPSQCTWTGGFVAVGKTAESARMVFDHVKRLEAIGCFGAELEVVPDRVAEYISKNTSMIMLGMGAGPGADAQYLFTEDVLGHTDGHRPRHAKTYRNFAADFERLQQERIAGFKVPRHVRFVSEWPTSSTKIQKFKLQEELCGELGI